MTGEPRYSETTIAHALARNTFDDCLCVVDRCTWPGSECDLLVITKNLRVVDVEIKISRADLKADRLKSKWHAPVQAWRRRAGEPGELRDWPQGVWKHFYCMPAPLWRPDLIEYCAPHSGILLVEWRGSSPRRWHVKVERRSRPDRQAKPISAEQAIAIARLASLRMWDAYADLDSFQPR